jgi:hypothetical protein
MFGKKKEAHITVKPRKMGPDLPVWMAKEEGDFAIVGEVMRIVLSEPQNDKERELLRYMVSSGFISNKILIVDSNTKIEILEIKENKVKVKVCEGKETGKEGWSPLAWIDE